MSQYEFVKFQQFLYSTKPDEIVSEFNLSLSLEMLDSKSTPNF